MQPTPLSHDFWLVLGAFVSFALAATGAVTWPAPPRPPVSLLALGAALIALALLW
jgi:hypothetical protein